MAGRIVIVGTGMAGVGLARELRRLDAWADLMLLSADAGHYYSKPSLSNALAGGRGVDSLVLAGAEGLARELRADLLASVRVDALDLGTRRLHTSAGEFSWDALVLAVGAAARRPTLAGDAAHELLSVNDLGDYARLRERLYARRTVAIVGAGLVGCEFANDLCAAGFDVEVHDGAAWPLPRLLARQAGEHYRARLEAAGVRFRLEQAPTSVERAGRGYALAAPDGSVRCYDLVLSAIGLQPRTQLARAAGLDIGVGIRTDRMLRTSAPGVHALGDCAEVDGWWLPYVQPLMQGAKALARTLLGEPVPLRYPAMPVVVKTPACPVAVCPPRRAGGAWEAQHEPDGLCMLHREAAGGAIDGFALLGASVRRRMRLAAELPDWLAGEPVAVAA